MQYHEASLYATAARSDQWPAGDYPEIVFAGRSNAGKSTLINALCNRKNLAYSGKTPGKTKLLNFFLVDNKIVFTDAPGYGYAKDDKNNTIKFQKLIDPYFRYRKQLKGLVLVADARRVPNDDDITMIEYGKASHLSIIVACTKADKLSRSQLSRSMNVIADTLGVSRSNLIACSSTDKAGMDDLWMKIDQLIEQNQVL
jgi:GTP-binding protein